MKFEIGYESVLGYNCRSRGWDSNYGAKVNVNRSNDTVLFGEPDQAHVILFGIFALKNKTTSIFVVRCYCPLNFEYLNFMYDDVFPILFSQRSFVF